MFQATALVQSQPIFSGRVSRLLCLPPGHKALAHTNGPHALFPNHVESHFHHHLPHPGQELPRAARRLPRPVLLGGDIHHDQLSPQPHPLLCLPVQGCLAQDLLWFGCGTSDVNAQRKKT